MAISEEVKSVVEGTAFLTLTTINADGTPHPIIAGKGTVEGDSIVFGIYKMEVTQSNIQKDSRAWVVGATTSAGPKGFRLAGTAAAKGKQLVFTPSSVEVLI